MFSLFPFFQVEISVMLGNLRAGNFVLIGGEDAEAELKKDGKRKFITKEQEPEQ